MLWPVGAELSVGAYLLRLAEPTSRDAAVVPSEGGGGLDYNRPPRMLPHLAPERFRLPGPPDPPDAGRFRCSWLSPRWSSASA